MNRISILGCGWYGLPLAKELKKLGWQVKGATTTQTKTTAIAKEGIEPFQIKVTPFAFDGKTSFLETDYLIINIPPKRTPTIVKEFKGITEQLIKVINEAESLKGVLFISSTSIYPDVYDELEENCELPPDKDSGIALLNAEKELKEKVKCPLVVLRFAGLIGPGRNPGNFLSGRKNIKNGFAPVNLVHLDDCISATIEVLNNPFLSNTYNICSDKHPLRKDYYEQASKALNTLPPHFDLSEEGQKEGGKIISNQKFKTAYPNWTQKYPDPSSFL